MVIGRAGMDLYPLPDGTKTEGAASFRADVGGSAANIAVALARQGGRAALLTCFSDDPVGRYVRQALAGFDVDTSRCPTIKEQYRTSLAFAETRPADSDVVIYRNGAADLALSAPHVAAADLAQAVCIIVTGTALAQEPSRTAVFEALSVATQHRVTKILDIDYRPYSWANEADARTVYNEAAGACDAVIGNDDEFAVLGGRAADPLQRAREIAAAGAALVVFKKGEAGSIAFADGHTVETPVFPVVVKKPFGAGDAFMGGLVFALLAGQPLDDALTRGAAAAALVVGRVGCASAMPTTTEIDTLVSGRK